MTADFFNVAHKAKVVVHNNPTKTAGIYAAGNVDISATVNEEGGMLDITNITDVLNLVNVKVGTAEITVDGRILAGIDLSDGKTPWDSADAAADAAVEGGSGDIHLSTNVMTEIEAGSSNKYLSSLAVSVAVLNSEINIRNGAALAAGGDINASSKGDIKVTTHASAGTLPISLAVTAVVSDVHTIVDGASIKAGGSVNLEAESNIEAETSAGKGAGNTRKSGGYFAVDVIIQNTAAKVLNQSVIHAGGDVNIHSTSNVNSVTNAVSAMDPPDDAAGDGADGADGDGAPTTLDSVKNIAILLLGNIFSTMGREDLNEKLTEGMRTPQYSVTQSVQNDTTKGQVSLSRSKANPGREIKVVAVPKEGYVIKEIKLLVLEPGQDHYTPYT